MASEKSSLNAPAYDQAVCESHEHALPSHGPPGYNTFYYHQPGQPVPSNAYAGLDSTQPLFPEDMEPYVRDTHTSIPC